MGGRNFQFSHSVSVLRVPSGEKGHPLVEVKTSGNIGSLCAAVGFTVAEDNKVVRQARESISLRYANMQATLPPLKPLFLAFVFSSGSINGLHEALSDESSGAKIPSHKAVLRWT